MTVRVDRVYALEDLQAELERVRESTTVLAPSLKAGDFVSWSSSKGGGARGKVVSVHTKGHVPAVPMRLNGTPQRPAARVRVYAKSGNGWTPTDTHVAAHADQLSRIDELPLPTTEATVMSGSISFDDLRSLVADAISDRFEAITGADAASCCVYVVDLGADWAVWCNGDDYWLQSYSYDGTVVTLDGDPVEVYRQTSWVADADDPGEQPEPAPDMAMMESATESVRIHEETGRLLGAVGTDGDGGRIFAVRIIAPGLSKNGRRYPESVLQAAAPLYEGAKAYDHHRTTEEFNSGSIAGLIGSYRNVRWQPDGIHADLHLLPGARHAAEALDASLEAQADNLPPLVGISHDVRAEKRTVVENGRRIDECTAIAQVYSSDVVSDPAAGGLATRMVAGGLTTTEGDPMTLIEQLKGATAEDIAALRTLLGEPAAATTETEQKPADATYTRESLSGRTLVRQACDDAGLPAGTHVAVIKRLPESFTEGDIAREVERTVEARAEIGTPGPKAVGGAHVTEDALDKKREKLYQSLCRNWREGYTSLREAYLDVTGQRPPLNPFDPDYVGQIVRESWAPSRIAGARVKESLDTTSWGEILGDSITRRMLAVYNQPNLQLWRQLVRTEPVSDFRTQRRTRLGGYGALPTVNQGAPYQPLTSATDEEATYAATKKGGTEDYTFESAMNDDLGALARIPDQLALAAAWTVKSYVFVDLFSSNPTLYDSVALFHASHSNTTAVALSHSGMGTLRKNMRAQTAYGTTRALGWVPNILIVPKDLEELAWEITTSGNAVPSTTPGATNVPNLYAGMKLLVVDELTDTNDWFVAVSPDQADGIVLGFLGGREDPELLMQDDPRVGSVFSADKVTWKIRHIYAGAVVDYRPFQRATQ